MFKPLLTAALSVAALAVASPVLAQTSQAKKELVARMLQLQQPDVEAMARSLAEQPAMQLMQQAGQALQRLPAERREAAAKEIQADLRKYADEAVPLVRDRAVKLAPSTMGPMLEERFTEEELRQVVALLESPVLRKFQGVAGELQRALTEKVVAETKTEVEPKVRAMQQSAGKRLGLTAAPAAGGAAPASNPKK
jgi:hypothetical protein